MGDTCKETREQMELIDGLLDWVLLPSKGYDKDNNEIEGEMEALVDGNKGEIQFYFGDVSLLIPNQALQALGKIAEVMRQMKDHDY